MEVAPMWIAFTGVLLILVLFLGLFAVFHKKEKNEELQLGNRFGCFFTTLVIAALLYGFIYLIGKGNNLF